MANEPAFLSATTILSDVVLNPEGKELGEIEDMMIDLEDGRIAYAVLSFGGMMGVGEKLLAIPWPMLKVDPEQKCFILSVSREMLEEAPGMDEDDWPTHHTSHEWLAEIYKHYGYDQYW